MRFKIFLSLNAAALAAVLMYSALLAPADARDPAALDCTASAATCTPESSAASASTADAANPPHRALAGACATGDLHVMHFEADDADGPVAAIWCQ